MQSVEEECQSTRWSYGTILAVACLVIYAGMFLGIAVRHVEYAGFLEPMEGDVLQHIQRVCSDEPLYPAPSADYIALSYMPLYYVLSAPFYLMCGEDFAGPRLLSVLCALGSGLICIAIAWRESRSLAVASMAGGLYFSSYRIMDAALTCALPDSMLLFWLLLGCCFWAYGKNRWHDVAWLVCFSLAFWTKQHGALFFGGSVLYALLFRKNSLPKWGIVAGLLAGGPLAYFLVSRWLGPGFVYTTLDIPGSWERSPRFSIQRTAFVLLEFVPYLCLLAVFYFRSSISVPRRSVSALTWFCGQSLAISVFTMMAAGSANNHYVPFIAAFCVAAALGARELSAQEVPRWVGWVLAGLIVGTSGITWIAMRQFAHHPIPKFVPIVTVVVAVSGAGLMMFAKRREWRAGLIAGLLVAGQFATAFFPLHDYVEREGWQAAAADLRSELESLDGPVAWVPYGYVPPQLAGKSFFRTPSLVVLEDIERQHGKEDVGWSQLEPFRRRIDECDSLYVLATGPLNEAPVWGQLDYEWELQRDYGRRFANLQQVTRRWYGGGEFLRYLYRRGKPRSGRKETEIAESNSVPSEFGVASSPDAD